MKIRYNFETKLYELYRGKKLIDTGLSESELARKYGMRTVYYDGTWMHLSK